MGVICDQYPCDLAGFQTRGNQFCADWVEMGPFCPRWHSCRAQALSMCAPLMPTYVSNETKPTKLTVPDLSASASVPSFPVSCKIHTLG